MALSFDSTGLTTETLEEIRQAYRDAIAAHPDLGASIQTGNGTRIGALIDVVAGREIDIQDLLPELLDQWDPSGAEGQYLENLAAFLKLEKNEATGSVVTLTLYGTPGTTVPAGYRARVPNDGPVFALDSPSPIIGPGGTVDAGATCTETGPYEAEAGEITEIVDAVSGWSGVTNAADAVPGQNADTDADLREYMELVGSGLGAGHPDSLTSDLIDIDSVTYAKIINNDTDSTDGYSTPPHSLQPVIWPNTADTDEIAAALYDHKIGGIRFYGSQSETVTSEITGQTKTVYWTWATEIDIYVHVKVSRRDGATVSADLKSAVKEVVEDFGNELGVNVDVEPDVLEAEIMTELRSEWDLNRCEVYVDTGSVPTPPAGDDIISMDLDEIARFDTTNMTVTEAS